MRSSHVATHPRTSNVADHSVHVDSDQHIAADNRTADTDDLRQQALDAADLDLLVDISLALEESIAEFRREYPIVVRDSGIHQEYSPESSGPRPNPPCDAVPPPGNNAGNVIKGYLDSVQGRPLHVG